MLAPITILSVSPRAGDHDTIAKILQPYEWPIHRASAFPRAWQLVRSHPFAVVICERDLKPYSWKDLLLVVPTLRKPPYLIVTSPRADDRLWAEALNLGAYDVLAKPFDAAEVTARVSLAVLHWRWNQELTLPLARTAEAVRVGGPRAATACRVNQSRW